MEEEQIFNHLDDLNKKHQHITSMQKQEDKEIEAMNRIQEAKEEELVKKLSVLRNSILRRIINNNKTFSKTKIFKDNAVIIEDYVVEREGCPFYEFERIRNSKSPITMIEVNGNFFAAKDNPDLFSLLNGDYNGNYGIVLEKNKPYLGYYYREPVLEQMASCIEGKSLGDARMMAIESLAYHIYLQDVKRKLCLVYGHDCNLAFSYDILCSGEVVAKYVCKICGRIIRESYDSVDDIKPLPRAKRTLELIDTTISIAPFRLEDYFIKIDRPEKTLTLQDKK